LGRKRCQREGRHLFLIVFSARDVCLLTRDRNKTSRLQLADGEMSLDERFQLCRSVAEECISDAELLDIDLNLLDIKSGDEETYRQVTGQPLQPTLDYARRHAGDYQGIAWIKCETRDGLLQGLAQLGARIEPGIAGIQNPGDAAARTLEIIEQAHFAKPWLLVFDNVEKPGDLDRLVPQVGAHVLITTRWSDWHGLAGKVDVGLFTPAEAAEFLCERAASKDTAGAAALAEALGYLPLALDHAASYVRSRKSTFARYLEDVSLREEKAAQALDRLRLLEAEIHYYLRHSKPLSSLDPQKINRLIQLAKQPNPVVG
jgi:hypothetical protein